MLQVNCAHDGRIAFIAPGVMLPPYRLGTLFEQAQRQQVSQCLYHSGGPFSLLEDHRCDRAGFPTVTTHILAQHTDEVWVMAFSHDGKFLASAGKDKQVVIWSIDVRRDDIDSQHLGR